MNILSPTSLGSHLGWIYINLALVRMPPYLREYSSSRLKHIPPGLTRVCVHVHRISGAAVQLRLTRQRLADVVRVYTRARIGRCSLSVSVCFASLCFSYVLIRRTTA